MQSKRCDLHHTWLRRETNEIILYYLGYCYRDPHWYKSKVKEVIHAWLNLENNNSHSEIEIPEAWKPTIKDCTTADRWSRLMREQYLIIGIIRNNVIQIATRKQSTSLHCINVTPSWDKQTFIYYHNNRIYYSTDARAAQIWSKCDCYLTFVHDRYPAIYVGCQDSPKILEMLHSHSFF